MSNPQTAEIESILTLAKQGDPGAIAALINRSLNPKGITARVGWKNQCLGILLEALPIPDQEDMITFIRQSLGELQPESVRLLKIGGYQPGQSVPVWYKEIELEETSASISEVNYRASSITSWLNQGLEANYGREDLGEYGGLPQSSTALQLAGAINSAVSSPGDRNPNELRFLRFCFNVEETALLPLTSIQQVLKVPVTEVLPVPHMPNCVLGIYNWRGEMLWLVDLAQQLGFPSVLIDSHPAETLNAIIVHSEYKFLGMVVPQIREIETYSLQHLQPPSSAFPTKLLSFMQGYFSSSGSPVLNPKALIQDPLLQVHRSDQFNL
jgi:positive phototaxis protein PixI